MSFTNYPRLGAAMVATLLVLLASPGAIAQEEFPAVNVPGSGGVSLEDARGALIEFVKNPNLLGLDVSQYNPDKDADGSGAKKLVDLLVEALTARMDALGGSESGAAEPVAAAASGAASGASVMERPAGEGPVNEAPSSERPSSEAPADEAPSSEAPSREEPTNEAPETEPSSGAGSASKESSNERSANGTTA